MTLLEGAAPGAVVPNKTAVYNEEGQLVANVPTDDDHVATKEYVDTEIAKIPSGGDGGGGGGGGPDLTGLTATVDELNLLDGADKDQVVNSKAVIYDDAGRIHATDPADDDHVATKLYVDGAIDALPDLTDLTASVDELNLLDGANKDLVVASKAVIYDDTGRIHAADPADDDHVVTKLYVDGAIDALPDLTGLTASALELNLLDGSAGGTVVNDKAVIYSAGGEIAANGPTADNHVATQKYVNDQIAAGGGGGTDLSGSSVELGSDTSGFDFTRPEHASGSGQATRLLGQDGASAGPSGTNGGTVNIQAGSTTATGNSQGGEVQIKGGSSNYRGGKVSIAGGTSANHYGGNVQILGGNGSGSTGTFGGHLTLKGGVSEIGGLVYIDGGNGSTRNGDVNIGNGTTHNLLLATSPAGAEALRIGRNNFVADFQGSLNLSDADESTQGLQLAGNLVTASALELNLLDGSAGGTVVNDKAVIYSAGGEIAANDPTADNHVATKSYVDSEISNVGGGPDLTGLTATVPNLNLLDGANKDQVVNSKAVIYDDTGRIHATDPADDDHVATKSYVDSEISNVGGGGPDLTGLTATVAELNLLDGADKDQVVASKAVIYDDTGRIHAADPADNDHVATKSYVDTEISMMASLESGVVNDLSGSSVELGSNTSRFDFLRPEHASGSGQPTRLLGQDAASDGPSGSDGGKIEIKAGSTTRTDSQGGTVFIRGGSSTNHWGGEVKIDGGTSENDSGGSVRITGGTGPDSLGGYGGSLILKGGIAKNGGDVSIEGGAGGAGYGSTKHGDINIGNNTTRNVYLATEELFGAQLLNIGRRNFDTNVGGSLNLSNADESTQGLKLAGNLVTASAPELNLLDGSAGGTVVNNKAVVYSAGGEIAANDPTANNHVATKSYVDSEISNVGGGGPDLTGLTATVAELNLLDGANKDQVVASKAVIYDDTGRIHAADPADNDHVATKLYVDGAIDALPDLTDTSVDLGSSGAAFAFNRPGDATEGKATSFNGQSSTGAKGGNLSIVGGSGTQGGDVHVTGGSSTSSGAGGNVVVDSGAGTGTKTVHIGPQNATHVEIGAGDDSNAAFVHIGKAGTTGMITLNGNQILLTADTRIDLQGTTDISALSLGTIPVDADALQLNLLHGVDVSNPGNVVPSKAVTYNAGGQMSANLPSFYSHVATKSYVDGMVGSITLADAPPQLGNPAVPGVLLGGEAYTENLPNAHITITHGGPQLAVYAPPQIGSRLTLVVTAQGGSVQIRQPGRGDINGRINFDRTEVTAGGGGLADVVDGETVVFTLVSYDGTNWISLNGGVNVTEPAGIA